MKYLLGLMAFFMTMFSSIASADIVTDAVTAIGTMKTGAETMSGAVLGVIIVIALAMLIYGLTRKAR